ncbi:TetR/AcrR family transcriptional regulator [Corynebacterium tapiri]|uniref:TetR/AcrR family transcriptional regulator n=1 Tax=Corynebacterium tapiri TaxID=1448266 RepID=A0A5C4U5Z8_9CORY|nr:TetR/AcrR family transcriptional regulator [Corynebacterium tapiri]TNL99227.1 TetR/AcrR family transcriptional regulator [Corynebacterium tapiri]
MPKITEERRQAQRTKILDATIAVIQRKGIAEMSMGDVIAESGLSAGGIYGQFTNKRELLATTARVLHDQRVSYLQAAAAATPLSHPADVLTDLANRSFGEGDLQAPALQVWAYAAAHQDQFPESSTFKDAITSALIDYLQAWYAHRGATDPEAIAREITPAVHTYLAGIIVHSTLNSYSAHTLKSGLEALIAAPLKPEH